MFKRNSPFMMFLFVFLALPLLSLGFVADDQSTWLGRVVHAALTDPLFLSYYIIGVLLISLYIFMMQELLRRSADDRRQSEKPRGKEERDA